MTDQVLHLVVPGLLGPFPRHCDPQSALQRRFPTLERWLARGDRRAVPADPERLLFQLFEAEAPARGDLPTAPLCYLADSGTTAAGGAIYHAEPVHLRPDQDRLLLFDLPADSLDTAQAAAFVAAFNDHFAADGWQLCAPTPGRWYLQVREPPRDLHTHPLSEVIGRNVDLFLPSGGDASAWRRRLTEVQMLFHGLPVNQQRQAQGQPPVNGLWLHGGGRSPVRPGRALQLDHGAPSLARGLARAAAGPPVARLRWLARAQRAVWDADLAGWQQAVAEVEQVLATANGELWLYPGDAFGYCCRPANRWRLWRRQRPLGQLLLAAEPA